MDNLFRSARELGVSLDITSFGTPGNKLMESTEIKFTMKGSTLAVDALVQRIEGWIQEAQGKRGTPVSKPKPSPTAPASAQPEESAKKKGWFSSLFG
jgi:hypothetical protein